MVREWDAGTAPTAEIVSMLDTLNAVLMADLPDDPLWQATMRFAFSPANPAYVEGRFGGLGSAHTPGVWPLGDVQEWVWASLSGDTRRAGSCLAKLVAIADSDGLLPETYDPGDARWLSRRWFAWPGSAVAAVTTGGFG